MDLLTFKSAIKSLVELCSFFNLLEVPLFFQQNFQPTFIICLEGNAEEYHFGFFRLISIGTFWLGSVLFYVNV